MPFGTPQILKGAYSLFNQQRINDLPPTQQRGRTDLPSSPVTQLHGSSFLNTLAKRAQNGQEPSYGTITPSGYKISEYGDHFNAELDKANAYSTANKLPLFGTKESWNSPTGYVTHPDEPGAISYYDPRNPSPISFRRMGPKNAEGVYYGTSYVTQAHEATHAGQLGMGGAQEEFRQTWNKFNTPDATNYLKKVQDQHGNLSPEFATAKHDIRPNELSAYLSDIQGLSYRNTGKRAETPEEAQQLLLKNMGTNIPQDPQTKNAGAVFNLLQDSKTKDPEYHKQLLDYLSRIMPGIAQTQNDQSHKYLA